ncbi:unnamed protein product [Linum trigynum]|uniref:Uncharacterized protein n=1 Tax=Linum trigynum TaxID=586398 RepID=A0AAV2EQA4_9ROSI
MAPRLREHEGDISPGVVKELAAKFKFGQESVSVVGINGMIEILPPAAPCADVTTTTMSLRSIVDDNCKVVVENRQVMVEIRRSMEESLNGLVRSSQQKSLKLASFSSMFDRRLDELLEATTENTNCLDKLKKYFIEPVVREISLPKNGIDPPPSIATEYTSILFSGGRTTQPWSEKSSSPMEIQLPLQHGGCGENLAPTFTTHVKQPPVLTVTHKTVSEARPCLNVRVGGGLIADVLQQACPPSMPSMLERPGGCKSPWGHEEGLGSLPNKVKCQAGRHIDVKKIEQKGVSNRIPCLSSKDYMRDMSSTTNSGTNSGLTVVSKKPLQSQTTYAASKNVSVAKGAKGDMSPSPCSGQGGMSSNMMNGVSGKSKRVMDTHATHDFHNFDSMSKSGQGGKTPCSMPPMNGRQVGMSPTTNNIQIDVPKKPQKTQATHAYSKHDSVANDDMGGMSSITTSRLIGVANKPQHEATHAFKHTNMAMFGKGARQQS